MKKLTEFEVQNALFSKLFQSNHHITPNYTPRGWWECDMFAVTKAGYFVEYEIKCTASDFRNDKNKERECWRDWESGKVTKDGAKHKKHDLIQSGYHKGPSKFYFVLPDGEVATDEVPQWAGVMRASRFEERVCIGLERKAPTLHRQMVHESVIHHVQSLFYYRFWNERRKDRGNGVTFKQLEEEA